MRGAFSCHGGPDAATSLAPSPPPLPLACHRQPPPLRELTLPSPGADPTRVDAWKQIAGDGDLDERCARIMGHWRHHGMPWDRPWWVRRLEERRRLARQRMTA